MNWLVPVAMLGWIPVALALFAVMPVRRALIWTVMLGYLFLPQAAFVFEGIPDYDKLTAVSIAALIGVIAFDGLSKIGTFHFRWFDLPIVVWCLVPIATSLANNLGLYDGLSSALSQTLVWGVPYLLARLYLTDLGAMRELATAIFIGGLIYAPLCLFEIRFSPQLHHWIYGYHAHDFAMTKRWGGFRPTVFLQHGLAVGMWMTAACTTGFWLWRGRVMREWATVPVGVLLAGLVVTAILCKSTAAIGLLLMGIAAAIVIRELRSPAPLLALLMIPPVYVLARTTGVWDGAAAVQIMEPIVGEERAGSLQYRLDMETILTDKALEAPVVGWGGHNRSRVFDEQGRDISTTDGLWIIALGRTGFVGLISLLGAMLLPVALAAWRIPHSRAWRSPPAAALLAVATPVALFIIDCLPNAMINPVFILGAGSLAGFAAARRVAPARAKSRRPSSQPAAATPVGA